MRSMAIGYVGGDMMENKFMSLAPYQLAGCLRDAGIDSDVVELVPQHYEDDDVIAELAAHDIVGFSCNTFTYAFARGAFRKLKALAPETVIVLGGIHAHHAWRDIMEREPVDFLFSGEADSALPLFVNALGGGDRDALGKVPGLVFRDNGSIRANAPVAETLSRDFPLPAYEKLTRTPSIAVFETSRGCPFRCTFCSIDQTSRWRAWEPPVVAERFLACTSRLRDPRLRNVMFADDNFATDQKRAAAVLRELHGRFPKLILSFETRAREILMNPVVLRTCGEEGIRSSFLFGIECGYDDGLKRLRKAVTVDEIRRSARLVNELGLQEGAVYSYIVGFPWETSRERLQTLALAHELFEDYGIKSTVFFWLPIPSPVADEFNVRPNYDVPFWWRQVQHDMNRVITDEEARLMELVNANGNFTDTRVDDTSRPTPSEGSLFAVPKRRAASQPGLR